MLRVGGAWSGRAAAAGRSLPLSPSLSPPTPHRYTHKASSPLIQTTPGAFGMRQKIYCEGSLLAAVQAAKLFPDCKHFVDMPLKMDPEATLSNWSAFSSKGVPCVDRLREFVSAHFDEPGCELEECAPSDFDDKADLFSDIVDDNYRVWAGHLHKKWPSLSRRVRPSVLSNPDRYSLIALPRPFIVPGGRFREMYYWDSFFTIRGLLVSKMYDTVKDMIRNMTHLIEEFGFVPNGNRIYYLNRSQPPLLSWMLHAYYQATGDTNFVKETLPTLWKEMEFFDRHRQVHQEGWGSHLYRYKVDASGPRPESYREDVESAEHIDDDEGKRRLWGDIAAAAESGRDFSSRWFEQQGPMAGQMGSTRTSSIVPVDLNAIICGNVQMMSEMASAVGDEEGADRARQKTDDLKKAIHQVLWSESAGCWFDLDLSTGQHLQQYFDTNFFPLFTNSMHPGFDGAVVSQYLHSVGALSFPGGIPSSLVPSGQQWDYPNAWAPTTWVVIKGLEAAGQHDLAVAIAEKWIRKNYSMWRSSGGRMFEKYDVVSNCSKATGGGGEYVVQEGFGWTNGVILDLLATYKDELSWQPGPQCDCCPVEECNVQ